MYPFGKHGNDAFVCINVLGVCTVGEEDRRRTGEEASGHLCKPRGFYGPPAGASGFVGDLKCKYERRQVHRLRINGPGRCYLYG